MPDNKEKLITAENQGKGVTPTAGSKMLIRPAADPIKIAPAPPKLDKNGNPVIPPYDATGKSFNEIADYYNSVEASRIDPSAVQEAGYDPYKQYEALGDESAFYAGGDWAKQASDQQGFGQQAKNAIVGGTLNGVVKAVEALSFIPNILTRDWEKSAFQESLAQAQQDINQALPVYSDPNNPLSMDSSMFWGGVKGVIESGLQFALPGKVISSGLGAISKGLSASSRALLGSEALALEATGASALGRSGAAGIEAVAARSSNGVTALLEGMIQNPAQRAALVEWAKSVPAGIIQNQLEGTIMGFEVYNAREQELRDAGITDEKYIKEEASAAANQMRNQNMLLIAKDIWEMKTIFGKPNKAVQSITDKSRWGFRPSDLKIWKKDVWQQAWKGGSNPFMLAVGEAGEEMFQAGLEGNIQNQARIRENLENAENPNYTPMDVDKTANVLSYMFTDQSIFEGMMGFFGGGFQNALVQIPGKIIDNRRYNKLNTELTAVNEAIEAEPDEQKKEVLRTQAAQIKSDIEGTLKGNYKAQQARITENEELIKDKFENLFDAHELHEAAVFDNDTVTRELIEDNMFVKAAMDNLKKGTLGAFRESLKEIEQGTDQAKTMVDGDITPEIQAKAKKMQERLTSIETEWNRHRDPQLGERKFFVGENKRNIGRAIENNNKKLDDNKARVNKDIAEYNKSQKAVNPDHVDIPSVDDINNPDSVTETEGVKSLSFDKEKANNFLKDAELQKSLNIASNLNKLQQENAIEEAYLNSAQYRKWKDKINTFISKNADKLNSSKLTELADEINNIDKKVNERTRFDGVSKKEVTGDTSKERQENRKDLKQAINEAAKKDLLKQINFLKDKIKVLEAVKELESLEKIREDSDKQKEVDLLGPFMQKAIDGNGYFHYTTNAGVKNYAHITNVSGLEQGDEIEYLVNGKTSATVSYFSELDEDGNITKLGFKDSFLQGNIKEATEEEYLQHIAEIKSKQPTTEKPVEETEPVVDEEVEEDLEQSDEEEPEEELITNNPIPVNEDNNPVGDTTPDTTLDPIDDTEIGNTPPQKVAWESNKLTEPSGVVSYSSRESVKDGNGKVRNKSNVRVLKPIDTQEYVVGTTGYFKVKPEDLSGPIESTPIEIILGNDKNNINSAYIPTLASLLSTEGSDMPGYFSEEDLSKSDESNRYLVLSNKGQEIVELIKQYDVNPTKEIFDRITDLIAAPFLANNITDLNPFTRIVTVNKESESKSRDFSIATTELIKLYKNRKQVISDINNGVKNPPTKIVSITGGNISLMVSNATETSPNTNVTPLRKFIKDTKVRIEKVNGLNKLYIPMKRELEGVANEQPFNIIVNPVNKELVHALFEDYLTQGEVTLGWDEKSIAQLLNTIWNYDYEGSYIELELDKAGSRRQIAFRKAGDKNNENTVFLQRKDLVENKLTEEQKDKINSYIGSSIVPVLSLDLGIKKKNIRSVKLVNGEIKEYKTSNRSLLLDNASTNILYTKGPNGEYIFHEQATYQLDYGLQIDEQIIEDNADVINNNEWTAFVDNGIVSDKILNDIANNIINNIPLSSRQISVFSDHTKGTSGISPSTRIENRLSEIRNNISNTESQVEPDISTIDDINNKFLNLESQIDNINSDEVASRDNLINKLIKNISLPANTRINNWRLEELIDGRWENKKINDNEEFFGKENWNKLIEAKKQFDIEFKKIEDSNLSKINLIKQKQSDLLSTVDGLELRKAWSFGLIEEPNLIGLDESNFISKETEFKNGNLVETNNYEGYYYLSKPDKDDEWYEQIIGKTEQEVKDKINIKYDAELAALNNTQTQNVLDTNNNKPIGLEEDDFSIATSEEYNSIVVDEDKNQELLNSYTINYPGMTYALQDDFINDFAARIIRRFIGSETSAPIINIKENLASVKQWYVTKFIPKQTNPLYQNMFEYYDQLENLALEKVVSMGLKIPGKSKRDLTSNEAEIGDFSGENGKAIERYDDSIFEMNDYDKASFRLKSKLSLIRNGDTSTGFPAYIDVETTYGIIRQALANKPNMTLPEALTYLKELKNQSEIINLVVKEIEKWDLSAQNEFRTVFNLHKNKTGIMLWNTIDGTYSANIIDADRSSGGRITLAKWQSRLFDMVNNPYNNMVVSTMDQPLMFNVDKINNIRDQYTDLVNDYYEYEKQTKNKPNHQPYAEKLASMLNEIGIDISTQEMLNIMDSPLEYARIGEGYERKYIKHIFDSNVGVIGVLFSQIGNIALSKTTLIDGVHYISQEDYNPYVSGGSYYNNLSKYISYVRGNIDSESAYSASGNIKFAYTIPSPLTKIVDDIRNGKYDKGQAREELSAFSKSSELIADALFDLEHMDAIKEENGDFVESNDLKDIEQELDELAGIQNNGNKTRYAQTATNSDKSTMVKMSMSAKQESSEFTEDNIENNSSYLVKAVEAESERMRQANTLSVDKADDKTINGLTGNVQFDNGHKYFYFLPTANIQIAKVKLKELVTSLLPPEALDKPENFAVPLEEARQLYSERYIDYIGKEGGFEEYIADNYEDYTAQLNNPDLAFFMLMAYGDANANEATFNYTVDDFIEKIIATNYDILNPVSVDGVGIKFDTAIPKNDFGFVSLLAANMFNEELAYKLDKWQKYNIGYETKNSTGLGLDKQWLAKVIGNGKNVPIKGTDKHRQFTNDEVREIAVREMIFYSHVANLEYYQIVVGDPASFYKGPINTKLNDQTAEQVNQIIKDTNTEAIKRNAKNLAAGTIPSFEILRYNEEAKEWQPHSQKTYMSAVIKDNKKATINASIKANPKLAEMFKKMNIADAQEYTSFEEHLHVMFAKGTPELNFDLYKTLLVKARAQDRLKWNEKVPEQYKLSDKELKFIFGMMKPVQVSNIKFKSGASVYNTQLEVYIKSSALPLIHQVFGGMELAKLKESMFYEGEEARTRPIDRMAYESAFKGGALRIADVWDGEGNVKPDGLNNIYPIELERSGFYIQQEIPYDETKNKILIMSQMDKLFTEGYIQHDKTDVIGRKEIVKKAMFDAAKKSFMEKMGAVDNNGVLSFKDPKVIIEVLKNEAVARGFSKNVTDQLELVDGQLPPIFFGSGAQKYESVLASLVSGIILQKVHGHSYVQASSSGVVTMGDLSQDAKNDIVYVEGFDPSKDLPFITIDEESNSISAAGVFVPFQFLDKDKVKLDINKFIIEKDGKRYLDPEKVPSELLNLIGGRIPGQGHNSMLPIRILGFLPEYMGNTIVVPGEITVQMGSDFDVDKLYAYMWNYSYDEKNGKLRMYNQETSAKGRIKYEEYKKYKTQRDAIKEEIGAFINEYGITDNKKEILSTRESLDNVADNIRLLELVIEEYWGEELTEEDNANIQDLLGKIKSFEKDRTELIEQLNEFKDTKTTLDDYDGGKALLERKRALYTEYQNTVTERIDDLVIEKNIKTLQNEYYDLHWEVLTNPVMFERIAESLDMDDLANEFDVMKGLQKDSATGLMSPRFNRSSFRENKDGKRGVAVYANFIVLNSMIQNMGIKLDHKGEDLVIKIKSTSGLLKLDILGNDAKSEFTYKLTEEQKEKGVELKPKGERRIHKNLQNGQNESLDNAKYGRLGALNLNEDTFNAANALLMLSDSSKKGYHNSDNPQIGAVANDHVVALMTQPVIYDFIDNKALRFNQFSGNRFSRAGEAKLKSDIIRKYYELLYKKEEDEKIRIPSHMELIKNVTIPSVNDLTNARNLNLQTATKEQLKSYYTVQLNAFVGFLALDEVGQLLAGTQKAIDASTKGIGKSFIESLGKERLYKERIEGTDYDSSYFGIKLNGADQLADTEYGYAVREGVMFGNELFKSVFPYKQIYNTVTDYFRNQNRVLTEEEYRNVFNYYKTYIFANDKLFSQSIIDERDRLKYSEDNIFDRVIKYQNEDNEGNYLLKSIAVETDKRNPKERKLRFAAGKAQRQDEKLNTVALLRMDASSDPEIKRLANDLISYSFLTNPVQSANNFMMYVPSSIFQSNIMRQYLNEANQVMVNGNINYTDFMDQFIRHNPTYAPSRKMFGQPFTIKELESYATYSNDLEKLKIQYAKPGLTDKEKKAIGAEEVKLVKFINAWFSSSIDPIYTELDDQREPSKYMHITFTYKEDVYNEFYGFIEEVTRVKKQLYKTNKDPKTGEYIISHVPILGNYDSRIMNSSDGFSDESSPSTYQVSNEEVAERLIPEGEGTIEEVLNNVQKYGNENQIELASILNQIVPKEYVIKTDVDNINPGTFKPGDKQIIINPNLTNKQASKTNREDIISTILHESMHPVINPIIAQYNADPNSLPEEVRNAVKRLDILRKDAIRHSLKTNPTEFKDFLGLYMKLLKKNPDKNTNKIKNVQEIINFVLSSPTNKSINTTTSKITSEMKSKYYGLVNLEEFVAMTWSDNNFQEVLNTITATKDEAQTFLQKLIDAFENLFQTIFEAFGITVNPDNVLAHTLAESYGIITHGKEVELNKNGTQWINPTKGKIIYSGDAIGSDRAFKAAGSLYGITTKDYVPGDIDKLTDVQKEEVEQAYVKAVIYLQRAVMDLNNPDKGKAYSARLVRRDYLQAKSGDALYAIVEGFEVISDKSKKGQKIIGANSHKVLPKGGTGYSMVMADNLGKPVYAFDQSKQQWYKYTKGTITKIDIPILTERFTGVGTRQINGVGRAAIAELFENTYPQQNNTPEQTELDFNNTSESIKVNETITDGIDFVFEENPELANEVYEVAGFKIKDTNLNKITFGEIDSTSTHDYYTIQYEGKTIGKIDLNSYGYIDGIEIDTKYRNKGLGKSIYRKVNSELLQGNLKSDSLGRISEDAKRVWESLVKSGEAVKTSDGYSFIQSQKTPQQKQQALQLYSQYLDTIFPTSKVKEIVYHGSNQKINQFEIKKEPLIHFGSKNAALQRGDVLNQVLLNVKDLQTIKDGMWFLGTDEGGLLKELLGRNILTIEEVKSINEAKNKAIRESPYFHENYRMALPEGEKAGNKKLQEIFKDKNIGFEYINLSEDKGSTSYAIPSQEQIHILGSKQDIEGFKKYVNKNNPIQQTITDLFNDLEIKKCGPGGGLFKAADGMKPKGFTKGGTWKIVKDLKGYPTHAKGGVDLSIGKDGVKMHNGTTQITAAFGLVIPMAADGMVVPDGEDNPIIEPINEPNVELTNNTFDGGPDDPKIKSKSKKQIYQEAIKNNYKTYVGQGVKTPYMKDGVDTEKGHMNCINGVCTVIEGMGAKKFNSKYSGNAKFSDANEQEGYYIANPENDGFEVGDVIQYARYKNSALSRFPGKVDAKNGYDLYPNHAKVVLDTYKDAEGNNRYILGHNKGTDQFTQEEVSETDLLEVARGKGMNSYNGLIVNRYDPDNVTKLKKENFEATQVLSGKNKYAKDYDTASGIKGVSFETVIDPKKPATYQSTPEANKLVDIYNKNYKAIGKMSDLPPAILNKLIHSQIGIASMESKIGKDEGGVKSLVPDVALPLARKLKDKVSDSDDWMKDYYDKNVKGVKEKYKTLDAFRQKMDEGNRLDKDAREYLYYHSERSKGTFQQKMLSKRGRYMNLDLDNPDQQPLASLNLAIDNFHLLKKKYPNLNEDELVDLTTLMHNAPSKALNQDYVDYYLKNKQIDYVNAVNKKKGKIEENVQTKAKYVPKPIVKNLSKKEVEDLTNFAKKLK
jgi:hypothetical protein